MKLSEIKVGAEYGAMDKPDARRFPRHVRVEEVVVTPVERWAPGGFGRATVNMRRVRIVLLDNPSEDGAYYSRTHPILAAAKDSTLVIEPKQLLAPWAKVRAKVGAEMDRLARERELHESIQARLRKVGIDPDGVAISTYVPEDKRQRARFSLRFDGKDAERILALAEGHV